MKYFKVIINETAKPLGNNNEGYSIFNTTTKLFNSITGAKEWLKDRYSKVKKEKVYRDDKNNNSYQAGWIYCFKNADWSHSPVERWWQKDWVEITEVREKIVI